MEERHTARLLLVDPKNRLLLMRIAPAALAGSPGSDRTLWVTLGGGVEPGESVLEAAERELHEETGIVDARVGPVVWYGEQILQINDKPRFLKENFVTARCAGSFLSDGGWTSEERQAIAEMRWWPLNELVTTWQELKPPRLGILLRELLTAIARDGQDSVSVRTIDLQ